LRPEYLQLLGHGLLMDFKKSAEPLLFYPLFWPDPFSACTENVENAFVEFRGKLSFLLIGDAKMFLCSEILKLTYLFPFSWFSLEESNIGRKSSSFPWKPMLPL